MNKLISLYTFSAIALIAIWFFAIYKPLRVQQESLNQKANIEIAKTDDFEKTIQQLPDQLDKHEELVQSKTEIKAKLFSQRHVLELVRHIESIADEQDIKITNITPPISELIRLNRESYNLEKPQFLNINLEIEGDYRNIGSYVFRLEKEPFFNGFENCHVNSDLKHTVITNAVLSFKAVIATSASTEINQ